MAASFPFISQPATEDLDVAAREVFLMAGGGQPTADLNVDERECRLAVEHFYQQRVQAADQYNKDRLQKDFSERLALDKQRYFDLLNARQLDGTNAAYLFYFQKPVLLDAASEQYYCELPEEFVKQEQYDLLPGEELVSVCEHVKQDLRRKQKGRLFGTKAQAEQFVSLYPIAPDFGYYRAGNRVWLTQDDYAGEFPASALQLGCVIRPERDKLPEPGLMTALDLADIVNKAYAMIMQRGQPDKRNDSNSTTK
ncbi:hypothetical protein [Hymenobacter glacieicola]|uniref:Uncharacterized protein n=1 Tax=Hymenobacter glacieicola TaxID=1562124 RepID=A0ABQ1X900_9BACT|nr:hypothetical protein [Hymenobacter glacieicola]GGG61271.1 hypothetical protein GCM10011378_41620 [Hymenobacter glacieicola]